MVLFLFVNNLHIVFFTDNYKEPLIDVLILFIIFNNYTFIPRDNHKRNHQRLHRIRKKAPQKATDEWSGIKCPFIYNGFEFLDIDPCHLASAGLGFKLYSSALVSQGISQGL